MAEEYDKNGKKIWQSGDQAINEGSTSLTKGTWGNSDDRTQFNNNAASEEVARLRAQGEAAQSRRAAGINMAPANAALAGVNPSAGLGEQRRATEMLSGTGGPSAAAASGNLGNAGALSSMLSARASGGSLARVLAGGASAGLSNAGNVGSMRANEISNRQSAFQGSANGLVEGGQSAAGAYGKMGQIQYGAKSAANQMGNQQASMNNAYQQAMEGSAFGVNQSQLNAELANRARNAGARSFQNGQEVAANNALASYAGSSAQAAGALGAGAVSYAGSSPGGSVAAPTQMNMGIDQRNPYEKTNDGSYYSDERTKDKKADEAKPGAVSASVSGDREEVRQYLDDEPVREQHDRIKEGNAAMARELADTKQYLAAQDAAKEADLKKRNEAKQPKYTLLNDVVKSRNPYPSLASFMAPDGGVLADANRKMAGEPYSYKAEFVPPEEKPGQMHYGFMAQNLEKNPVTATAVETGPDGLKRVNRDRMVQTVAAGVSDLQRQVDQMRKGK